MLFRSVVALFSGAFVFTQGVLALTPSEVVTNIDTVATLSANLYNLLGDLTTSTAGPDVKTAAKNTVNGFQNIINTLSGDVLAMQGNSPFADADAQPIVDALTNFVTLHQALLATLIGKHPIFAQFGHTAPIAAVLGPLEDKIDSFALSLITLIPTRKSDVDSGKAALDDSVGKAISVYQQVCVPSADYPTVLPICT